MQSLKNVIMALAAAASTTACMQERGQIEYFRCDVPTENPPPPATSNGEYYGLQNADGKVIFERDVLPLLQSTATGKVYKCTVCHAGFADPAALSQPGRIDALVARMEMPSSQQGFMPVNGDPVAASDIAIFKAWQTGGYLTTANPGGDEPTQPTDPNEPTSPETDEPGVTIGADEPTYDGAYDGASSYDKPSADAKPATRCGTTTASSGNQPSY